MGVNLRGADLRVSQHFLHGTKVCPDSIKWVAKLCRKVCGLTFLRMPAAITLRLSMVNAI